MYQPKTEKDLRCPLEHGIRIFGGKWKVRVICALYELGSLRYVELKKKMYTITDAVLTSTLKELTEDGIVDRFQYEEIPPRVVYSLSDKGLSIIPLLHGICEWTETHCSGSGDYTFTLCSDCRYIRKDG